MSELKRRRFERLHTEFDQASGQNRRLRYIAATGIHTCPEWPLVPYPSLGANHYGLRKPDWLDVSGRPAGSLFTPMGGSQWLLVDGRLWEGSLYFDGPDENPTNDDPESLKRQYERLLRAKELFEELATEAAGFLPSITTPHRMVDHPRRPELWHRWLESICAKVEVESAGLHAFDVRRVPGNIFQASALHLEELENRSAGVAGNVDPADAGQALLAFRQFVADTQERENRELAGSKAEAKQENLAYEKQLRTLKELQNEIERTFRQRLIEAGFTGAELANGIAFLKIEAGDPRSPAFHAAMVEYRHNWALMVEFLNESAKPDALPHTESGTPGVLIQPTTPISNDEQQSHQGAISQRLQELAEAIEAGKAKRDAERLTDADRRQLRVAMEKAAEQAWHVDLLKAMDFQNWERMIIEFVKCVGAAGQASALDEAVAHFASLPDGVNQYAAEVLRQVMDHRSRSEAAASLRLAYTRGFLPQLREAFEGLCERAVAPQREQSPIQQPPADVEPCQPEPPSDLPADGPQPPDAFHWHGNKATLTPKPFRLVEYLWQSRNRTAEVIAAALHVDGDEETASAVPTWRTRANGAFLKAKPRSIPAEIRITGRYVSLSIADNE